LWWLSLIEHVLYCKQSASEVRFISLLFQSDLKLAAILFSLAGLPLCGVQQGGRAIMEKPKNVCTGPIKRTKDCLLTARYKI
jgi:hypothetical protein